LAWKLRAAAEKTARGHGLGTQNLGGSVRGGYGTGEVLLLRNLLVLELMMDRQRM